MATSQQKTTRNDDKETKGKKQAQTSRRKSGSGKDREPAKTSKGR